MADRRRGRAADAESFRRHDWRDLTAALRREARDARPTFSPAVHEGVLAALAARAAAHDSRASAAAGEAPAAPRPRMAFPWRAATGGLAAVAACVAIAVVTVGPRGVPPATVPEAKVAEAGIERLPTPDEIGATVFAQVATFAALAVGIPELPDLAALEPGLVATAEDPTP